MWSFVLTTLSGQSLGEITNADDRKVSTPLNRTATASFKIPLDHRHADRIIEGDCLVKAYENVGTRGEPDKRLRFVGEIASAEEVAGPKEATVAVVASDGLWRLQKRLIGKSSAGYSNGTAVAPVDRGQIAKAMIDAANAEGDTGVRPGTIGASSTTFIGPLYYQPIATQIASLSVALDGYDFFIEPREPAADAGGVAVWNFHTYAYRGQRRTNAIFEFGTGKRNVKGYKRPVTKDGMMTDGYALPPGFPDNAVAAVLTASNATRRARYGRFEDVLASELTDSLRQTLINEHVRIRSQPRQTITFDPAINSPQPGRDFFVGDTVTFRAVRGGRVRINAIFRVYGVDISIDRHGRAETSISIVPE